MQNKGLGCLAIFLGVALVVSVFANVVQVALWFGFDQANVSMVQPKQKFAEHLEDEGNGNTKDKVVQIDLEGVITGSSESSVLSSAGMDVDGVKRALEQAREDSTVKAIVLRVNSPGGEVTASDELYRAIKDTVTKGKKPVVVYMDAIAASGGYYLSCGASHIIANETTLTGSIGVIMETLNYSDAFNKLGLNTEVFKSGAFKDTLSGSRPMRDDEKAYVQSLVMQMYDKFVGIVSEARKIPTDTLKTTLADGRVFTGEEALKDKLVDQLGYIEDAYAKARELGGAPDAMVVRYQKHSSLSELLFGASSALPKPGASTQIHVDVADQLLPHLKPGCMYMLPAYMVGK